MKTGLLLIICILFSLSFNISAETEYRIIYIIHGDANYYYHDENGKEISADKRILNQAINAAENASRGEVFIFHQKKGGNFLLLFSENDGSFFYYKNGKKISEENYSKSKSFAINSEAEIFRKYVNADQDIKSIFLYYGHEIPGTEKKGYNVTYPNKIYTIKDLSIGIKKFAEFQEKIFDLIVLSTCNNGTRYTIKKLSPFADKIIASPENLHLSYIDSGYLKLLEGSYYNFDRFVYDFAEAAFNKLKENVHTVITVSVYDTKKSDINMPNFYSSANEDNVEVKVYYSPPKFGRNKYQKIHTGWGKDNFPENKITVKDSLSY